MNDFFDDFGWEEMALAGALAEEMGEEKADRRRVKKEMEQEGECPCCSKDCDPCDPPDEEPYP